MGIGWVGAAWGNTRIRRRVPDPDRQRAGTAVRVGPVALLAVILLLAVSAGAASAEIVADSGFRPGVNGFSFDNYGNEANPQNDNKPAANLGPDQVVRLFGARVCEGGQTSPCTLTPTAATWMADANKDMNDGHCAGFAKLTLMLYKDQYPPLMGRFAPFGTTNPFAVPLAGSEDIQRGIAYGFVFQILPSVLRGRISGTPVQVLDALKTALNAKTSPETYSLGFYKFNKATNSKSAGHEVTPYAVDDLGNGQSDILLYDNNYPNQTRRLRVDTNTDTWSYSGSTSPAVTASDYVGDATSKTLELDPTTPGLGIQPCPFCGNAVATSTGAKTTQAAGGGDTYVSLEGDENNHPHLGITDAQGHRLGYFDGRFIDDFPGPRVPQRSGRSTPPGANDYVYPVASQPSSTPTEPWLEAPEPIYILPGPQKLTIQIDGRGLKSPSESEVSIVGPSSTLSIEKLRLKPGERDTVTVPADGNSFTYEGAPGQSDSPSFNLGADEPDVGWDATFGGERLTGPAKLHFDLGLAEKTLSFDSSEAGVFRVLLQRDDAEGQQQEEATGVDLAPNQVARASYRDFRNDDHLPVVKTAMRGRSG